MHEPPVLPSETERLAALRSYGILDTAPTVDFDSLASFIASVCNTPIAAITLVDDDRQWFKAAVGLTMEQTSRDIAFCAHAIAQPSKLFIVPNATVDERFMRNPLVTGAPNVCFYAGMPIVTRDGHALGAVCVIDREPRELTALQFEALAVAARLVMTLIEHTSTNDKLRRAEEARNVVEQQREAMANYLTTVEDERIRVAEELHIEASRFARLVDELNYAKTYDALTTLPNRQSFLQSLKAAFTSFESAVPDRRPFAVLIVDLDHCKQINDSLGNIAGDELLVQCGERILDVAGRDDVVARLDSDLFAMIAFDTSTVRAATAIGRRLLSAFKKPWHLKHIECLVTASIGIVVVDDHHTGAEHILRDADIALQHSKQRGRDRFSVFTRSLGTEFQSKVDLVRTLSLAIGNDEFQLVYQPIVSLVTDTRTLEGFEALLRWQRSDGVRISPAAFVPAAEESGLIVPLGLWALKTACLQLRHWHQQPNPREALVQMSVNVSAIQLASPRFAATVRDVIRESEIDPRQLIIEVTESAALQDPERSLRVLCELRELGIGIHVDDFGTGYSSLSYLRKLPVTRVKIDRSFVSIDEQDDLADPVIVAAIISLAHQLNIKVIAEGVETATQLRALIDLGCDSVQGFYVSRPVGPQDAEAFMISVDGLRRM